MNVIRLNAPRDRPAGLEGPLATRSTPVKTSRAAKRDAPRSKKREACIFAHFRHGRPGRSHRWRGDGDAGGDAGGDAAR